jgi:uncharacterized protein YqhQ
MDETRRYVGGQAVIEGVMMRAPGGLAVAARRRDGTIVLREDAWVSLLPSLGFLRWPLVRGALVLAESLANGLSALQFSALVQEQTLRPRGGGPGEVGPRVDAPLAGEPAPGPARAPVRPEPLLVRPRDRRAMAGSLAVSFALAMALFVGLPHLLAWGTGRALDVGVERLGFHVLDGLYKLAIFVGYIWGIGRIPEIARVFQYHGAEHKAVTCYEQGRPLTLAEARRSSTFHARCGTSFMLFVLTLSIFVFAAVLPLLPLLDGPAWLVHLSLVLIKIPLMLPLAGVAYEINRYAAAHPGQLWVQAIVAPGRLMQKLTTREPTDDQLEIALTALRAALAADARALAPRAEGVERAAPSRPARGRVPRLPRGRGRPRRRLATLAPPPALARPAPLETPPC